MAEELSRTERHEMSECKILCWHEDPPPSGAYWPSFTTTDPRLGTGVARCRCETHGIELGGSSEIKICSIGLIEKAALDAIDQIGMAAREALK